MTGEVEAARLTVESIHPANLVALSDGSTWKVSPESGRIVRMWRKADPVVVKANLGNWDWAFRIVHLGSGASAPATPSLGPDAT